jgi:hypothetical protein
VDYELEENVVDDEVNEVEGIVFVVLGAAAAAVDIVIVDLGMMEVLEVIIN